MFFSFVKLCNRVFQQAGPFVRTFNYLKIATIPVVFWDACLSSQNSPYFFVDESFSNVLQNLLLLSPILSLRIQARIAPCSCFSQASTAMNRRLGHLALRCSMLFSDPVAIFLLHLTPFWRKKGG